MDASSSPWNPAPAPVSSPSLLLPIPAIVFIAVGTYLLLLGAVLLARHCLLAQGCCTDCSSPCKKQGASRPQDCCWTCAEACDFPLPSPAHCLDACCPQPTEAVSSRPSPDPLSPDLGPLWAFFRWWCTTTWEAEPLLWARPRSGDWVSGRQPKTP
ncbi:uncharaterized LOC112694756 homolog isoform X1 [Ailuropoda melanoleuca]|uniref:uncharaterized LOC112694756 homolog isoform X1 n=1 Tax=Ailuropoda melanoleuca TaxID=9646 RepID=UPI001494A399|nr:uncharaterized LOC112694756 homolog isoform X1 [Ailuropoda melanoleuca]